MRNSVSLSVYFLLVLRCDVNQLLIEKKTKSASGKMKLIPLLILLTNLADIKGQKFRQEQFPFPPQFQTPNAGMFSSDSSLYLPPESHTPIPYFPFNKVNGLPYPLLPPTGTKAPAIYPPHFPLMISSTLVPNFEDDDDDEDHGRIRLPATPQPKPQIHNQTEKQSDLTMEKREMRTIPGMTFQQSIQNRNDIKFPFKPQAPASPSVTSPSSANYHQQQQQQQQQPQQQQQKQQQSVNPAPATRRMIISAETQKADVGFDQVRAASFQGPQFLPAGSGIYVSSTTEPAIPILRLSNEMDLDGSFSYEALGADQTHYVQHSRMENLGPDKTEQVVEGSYSYVGDNGQTYTVHYIADANGFRASGDHLPVAPPVPEIIQRAVQYNLAEEAKKPPHFRDNGSWQDNGNWQNNVKDNEISDNTKNQQFASPPVRNLFTGRTPEAFSYSYSQGTNTGNNLVAAASTQNPVKTVDYTTEQPKLKPNNGPISPQITFLASQGAHVPSMNTVQDTISRMFTTEKSSMPQLVNYEAGFKEAEQDPNKGLWRWQYGYNANSFNQNPNKDMISRSFGEGDDIMINFSDMTPEQYTKMIHSQFEYAPETNSADQHKQNVHLNDNQNVNLDNQYSTRHTNKQQLLHNHETSQTYKQERTSEQKQYQNYLQNEEAKQEQLEHLANYNQNQRNQIQYDNYVDNQQPQQAQTKYHDSPSDNYSTRNDNPQQSISTITPSTQSEHWYKQSQNVEEGHETQSTALPFPESRKLISNSPKILTHKDFVHPTQTITQSYDFDEDTFYEPRKIKALYAEPALKATSNTLNNVQPIFQKTNEVTEGGWINTENEIKQSSTPEPHISSVSNFKFSDFIFQEDQSDFKPIITSTSTEIPRLPETTTENIIEDMLQNNIFLKNMFNIEKTDTISTQKTEVRTEKKVTEEPQKIFNIKVEAEPKADKVTKFVPYHPKPMNEVKIFKKKPMDISDIINYVSMKNHFESSKMKPKNKPSTDFDQRNEVRFIPIQQEIQEKENIPKQKSFSKPHVEHQEELKGIIRNYKVLQRNNNVNKYDNRELKRELSPPPLKSPNLPPLGRAGPSMKSYLPPIFV